MSYLSYKFYLINHHSKSFIHLICYSFYECANIFELLYEFNVYAIANFEIQTTLLLDGKVNVIIIKKLND